MTSRLFRNAPKGVFFYLFFMKLVEIFVTVLYLTAIIFCVGIVRPYEFARSKKER